MSRSSIRFSLVKKIDLESGASNSYSSVNPSKSKKTNLFSEEVSREIFEQLEKKTIASTPTLGTMAVAKTNSLKVDNLKNSISLRRSFGQFGKILKDEKDVTVDLSTMKLSDKQFRNGLVGLTQGMYSFDRYRKNKTSSTESLNCYLGEGKVATGLRQAFIEAEVLAESVSLCRDLINTPAEDMGPDQFEKAAREMCKTVGLKIKVMNEKECEKEKMGALLAVGRASHRPSRLLMMEWAGRSSRSKSKMKDFLALCGKGVCFDTGGLGLKPGPAMTLMRKDMGGSATVFAVMRSLALLKAKTNVKAYIPLVENSLGPEAFRPGDILTASDGTTIEVGHTDAEGRLVLADAICKALKEGAKSVVTVATLTGAAMVALGRIHVPIMGDKSLIKRIEEGAKSSGEKVWELPLDEEHSNKVRGEWADLTNSDSSGEAGCITAGAFLKHFAKDVPFAHCDISPACFKTGAHELGPAGATGVLVTTLVDAFRDWR